MGKVNIKRLSSLEAEVEYDVTTTDIDRLTESINKKLDNHWRKFQRDTANWGYVGDLKHVKELLTEIDTFLRG